MLNEIEANYLVLHQYDNVQQEVIDLKDHYNLIRDFITLVKQNPTVNLTQYNNWLATKQWWEAATVRFFVYKLATQLAQKAEVTLTSYTESQVLQKLRDWIVATAARKIEKVIFNI
jgi:hypothetical protein